jgi:CRISPR-associated protein Cmr3
MKLWIIEPHDPLITRDGRPFDPTPGARASSLPFPLPSTIAGAVRTRAGSVDGNFTMEPADARNIGVAGPLLVALDDNGYKLLAPAPADALLLRHDDKHGDLYRLAPGELEPHVQTDLPSGLLPIPAEGKPEGKPHSAAPRFWHWEAYARWLHGSFNQQGQPLAALGLLGPTVEQRIHVGIRPETYSSEEGMLFATRGYEFGVRLPDDKPSDYLPFTRLSRVQRLALAALTDAPLVPGVGPLGGERRLAAWRPAAADALPALPPGLAEQIADAGGCRVLLLTPAAFAKGWRPDYLLQPRYGVTPTLRAAAVGRPQVVSGWDLADRKPKVSRRLAPQGSVYWLKLEGTRPAVMQWVDAHWFACVSDDEQARRDGFGLAALGVWEAAR